MEIVPIKAFADNYIWLLREGRHAVVVDPGDAEPVMAHLDRHGLELSAILITHHHGDHAGGIEDLLQRGAVPVFGPVSESIDGVTQRVAEPDRIRVPGLDVEFEVLDLPGHTRGHVGYYRPSVLFCGDTLFGCGCGRLFEGTPAQMARSLAKLAALPGDTRVYCAHEYTQSNVRFALAVEPDNAALRRRADDVARARAADEPTVPSTIALERETNPFLRATSPRVIESARAQGAGGTDPVSVFAAIREWKNRF